VILSFLALFVTVPAFAEDGFDGSDSLITRMVTEITTAPVLYPEINGLGNYPPEATLVDFATESASTRLTRAAGSTNSSDLQLLMNTTWEFTSNNSLIATISCGSTFTNPLFGGEKDVMLNCTTAQNERVITTYVLETGEYYIVIYGEFIPKLQFVVKLHGCCSMNGRYHDNTAVASNEASLTGTRTNPPAPTGTGTNLPNPTGTATNPSVPTRDFDGDGKDDILWYNKATGDLFLYTSSQGNYLSGNVPVDLGWTPLGVFDYDKDGRADLLWWNRKTGGEVYVWLGNGYKGSLGFVSDTNWKPCCGGDLDGDGFGDILWNHQTTGGLYVWYTDKNQTKVPYGGVDSKSGWLPKGVADFDGDGRGDILWWNQKTGELFFWTTKQGNYPLPGVPVDTGWRAVGAGNFDGDKKPDLLWWNQNTGEVYIWHDGGKGPRTSRGKVPDLNWSPM
jgi:hypothetical protein